MTTTSDPTPAAPSSAVPPCAGPEAEDVTTAIEPRPDGWEVLATRSGRPLDLSELLPITEAFGFRIVDATSTHHDEVTRHRLRIRADRSGDDGTAGRLDDALAAALAGDSVVDGLLALLSTTSLTWHQVDWLRAARRMLELLGSPRPGATIDAALVGNPDAAWAVANLFRARLDPAAGPEDEPTAFHALEAIRDGVASLVQDRILDDLATVVRAITRTNAFTADPAVDVDGRRVPMLACKFSSASLPVLPDPAPWAEVLVTSPMTTGIHLRAGAIARGGLRASDRWDVRHEVLDLMAAQVVKNSMIVPTGAKGGFIVHDGPATAGDRRDRIRNAYRVFVTGLLSVTDTVEDGRVVGPAGVRRRDGDDPYLVVAADKGTAPLSDTANQLAADHDFWLDDAFASGGSSGWDHKALGITAAGAWVAIARHFRELGLDIHTDRLTVVGIGDMSGDVFGNGLLTSRTLRLVAAFDHRDIFLDPDPDPATSFDERQRLFRLPGSSWQDYDRSLLSPGGMVVSRTAKSVATTDQVRDLLGIEAAALAPDALVRAVLAAKVDLLYAGGIGTVVQASGEDFGGDHANDDIRIDAADLNARVVGEGANLAITPRGRIEYARRGGRIDQDAIHNAGGVAISDREVNAKILFAPALARGQLTRSERDEVLHAAAGAVVADVCRDVDAQVWLLSRAHATSARDLAAHARHLDRLEAEGTVDRVVDLLPTPEEFDARAEAGAGLTRPELASVMAATKRTLYATVLAGPLVGVPSARPALDGAFPSTIRDHPAVDVRTHRLADEITALRVASGLVDRLGITHLHEVAAVQDRPLHQVATAHWVARQALGGDSWWPRLQDHATQVPPDTLEHGAARLATLQRHVGLQVLRTGLLDDHGIDEVQERLRVAAEAVRSRWRDRSRGTVARRRVALLDDLVPDDLALDIALADRLGRVGDLAVLANGSGRDLDQDLLALTGVDRRLHLPDLQASVQSLLWDAPGRDDDWTRRHGEVLLVDLGRVRRDAARRVLATSLEEWSDPTVARARDRVSGALSAVRAGSPPADVLGSAVATLRALHAR